MEGFKARRLRRLEQARRRSRHAGAIETVLIMALAALVFLKGAPALAGIAFAIGEMMMALTRL